MFTFIDQDDIYHLINGRTPMALSRALSACFRRHNIPLSKEQFSIMVILWKKEGLTQQYLASLTFRDKPGVTRLIDSLERMGLVERKPDPFDRRANLIFLTDSGKKIEVEVTEAVKEIIRKASKGLSEEDGKNLKRILGVVYDNLSK